MNSFFFAENYLHIAVSVGRLELLHLFWPLENLFIASAESRDIADVISDGHPHCHIIKKTGVVERYSLEVQLFLFLFQFCIFLGRMFKLLMTLGPQKFQNFVLIGRHLN